LLLRVGTLWRCSDGLFFELPPLLSDYFVQRSTHFSKTCCRPLITSKFLVSELPFHGWSSREIAWGELWIELCVRFGKSESVEPHQNIRHIVQISSHNHGKGAPKQDISKLPTVCSTFSRSGWSVVRSASLAKGGTSKKILSRTSTKFQLGVIR
jgi:hypothetical protein